MKSLVFHDMILLENDDYLIINKPAMISTLEDRQSHLNILSMARMEYPDIKVGHRLDKETSGVLVLAKHDRSYTHLTTQFEKRAVTKKYRAVVMGVHNFDENVVDQPLSVTGNGITRIDVKKGKSSLTSFTTAQAYRNTTLLDCFPLTGRTHQIRAHLAFLGAPIIGDLKYGGKNFYLSSIKSGYNLKKETEERPLINRIALHASMIEFKGLNNTLIRATADYPKDMRVLIKQIERYT